MTVNRWFFNKQWAAKVVPALLGQRPNHPLLRAEVDAEPRRSVQPRKSDRAFDRAARNVPAPGFSESHYAEIVFGGEEAP
jgi:hypothetical protein